MSKRVVTVVALTAAFFQTSCTKKDEAAPTPPPPATASAAAKKPPALSGTDGGGDGSGSSIANARALRAGESVALKVTCNATLYLGPFRFTKDPETVTVAGTFKTPTGDQICLGGDWVDVAGKSGAPGGLGCVDGKHVGDGKATFEYSPGNGGNNTNPAYLALKFAEPKPAGCPSLDLTLKIVP